MQYTLKELFDNLEITLIELSRRSGISDVTLISIRNGKSARRSTINTLLRTFSELYGTKLTLKNVSGIIIQGKPAGAEQAPMPSVSTPAVDSTGEKADVQNRPTIAKKSTSSQTSTKKSKNTGLPEDAILATYFAKNHDVKRETFRDHMLIGLGPGSVWGQKPDPVMGVKDHVEFSEHVKRTRKDGTEEKERYLTASQQAAALEFWKKWKVEYSQCDRAECPCKGE